MGNKPCKNKKVEQKSLEIEKRICKNSECSEIAVCNGVYCDMHTCKIYNCSSHIRIKDYCISHCCFIEGCTNATANHLRYCDEHRCRYKYTKILCKNKIVSLNSYFCEKHTCCINNCKKPIVPSIFCLGKPVTFTLCFTHKCIHYSCTFPKQKDNDKYCIKHNPITPLDLN